MGGLLIDVFILWIIKTIRNGIRMKKALRWQIADGKMVRSRIVGHGFKYRPVADYSFDVNGELFYGQASGHCQNSERAADLADMMVPGASLKIRYDASDPNKNMALNRDNPDFKVTFEEIPDPHC